MTEFGREYGEGLYALCAEEGLAEAVLQELACLRQAFRENDAFLRLLSNMSLSKEERVGIAEETFRGQVQPYVLNFIKILTERGAAFAFADCVRAFEMCYQQDHRVAEAEVTTARPLDDAQRAKLLEKLGHMTGKQVRLREKVDPSLLGGVLLQLDGKRYDNTVRHRLETMKQVLSGE